MVGQTGAKNLWTRVWMDSPAKKQVSAARSAESGRLIVGVTRAGGRLPEFDSQTQHDHWLLSLSTRLSLGSWNGPG